MRASQLNIATLREDPADAEIASHRLLMRAGFLHKSGSGLYLYGHFLKRVLDKISRIVSEEISTAGGVEITMPILQERGLWERSGRWSAYQATRTMLTVRDRSDQEFGLAPTAEEVVTDYAASQISSYKQLPVCYFQQHTKFRDEIRPRFGLMRVKEFIMMDAYSFHADDASLQATYRAMHDAYLRAFSRCGLESFAVEADPGAIGGQASHEFMVAAEVGEDAILLSDDGYAANVERAECRLDPPGNWDAPAEPVDVHTPGTGSIDAVLALLRERGYADLRAEHILKCVLFMAQTGTGERSVAAFVRGDRDVNEVKLHNAVDRVLAEEEVLALRPMNEDEVRSLSGAEPGFAGPGVPAGVRIWDAAFDGFAATVALVVGANRSDYHRVGWRLCEAAQTASAITDIVLAVPGDRSPRSDARLHQRRGIEVGHIFQLGTKYSTAMGAEFTGHDGQRHPLIMGCYGIGTSRLAAAAVEQHHDRNGMCWPVPIAPYHCAVVPTRVDDEAIRAAAERVYDELRQQGVEGIFDDREAKPGVKFKDWDLIGLPVKVIAGRGVADGTLEVKTRAGEGSDVPVAEVAGYVCDLLRREATAGLSPEPI